MKGDKKNLPFSMKGDKKNLPSSKQKVKIEIHFHSIKRG